MKIATISYNDIHYNEQVPLCLIHFTENPIRIFANTIKGDFKSVVTSCDILIDALDASVAHQTIPSPYHLHYNPPNNNTVSAPADTQKHKKFQSMDQPHTSW